MITFEEFWLKKREDIKTHKVEMTLSTVKTLCYLAWVQGAKNELRKEVEILRKATNAMKSRARAQTKRRRML